MAYRGVESVAWDYLAKGWSQIWTLPHKVAALIELRDIVAMLISAPLTFRVKRLGLEVLKFAISGIRFTVHE